MEFAIILSENCQQYEDLLDFMMVNTMLKI